MDPNDPTRIQPTTEPPDPQSPVAWPPPPPSPHGPPAGYDAPPTAAYPVAAYPVAAYPVAAYPVASPPTLPFVPQVATPDGGGPQPSGSTRGLPITVAVLAVLLAGLIGFILGVQVEKNRQPPAASTTTTATTGGNAGAGRKGRGRSTAGVVTAVGGNGFTLTLSDGTTVNVVVSGTTRFTQAVAGSLKAPAAKMARSRLAWWP
jgi:hypothetical protein